MLSRKHAHKPPTPCRLHAMAFAALREKIDAHIDERQARNPIKLDDLKMIRRLRDLRGPVLDQEAKWLRLADETDAANAAADKAHADETALSERGA